MKKGNFEWTDDTHTTARFVECEDGKLIVYDDGLIKQATITKNEFFKQLFYSPKEMNDLLSVENKSKLNPE